MEVEVSFCVYFHCLPPSDLSRCASLDKAVTALDTVYQLSFTGTRFPILCIRAQLYDAMIPSDYGISRQGLLAQVVFVHSRCGHWSFLANSQHCGIESFDFRSMQTSQRFSRLQSVRDSASVCELIITLRSSVALVRLILTRL